MIFRDPSRPLSERARDLYDRLTDDERLAMLHQAAPAIERLGLGEFRTGCEALHGVAWLGVATVFPQPVGLAATWDTDLLRRIGEVVSTEVRAKKADDPLVSLNVWAPVVNTLRHPAWGRNEEGYSEDPHLTAHLATAYSRGLRGDHPRVWRTVPSLKHFLAYSNETDRSATSSEMSPRTLHEEELPAFRESIAAGVAGSLMLAYNRVNGVPAHTQPELVAEARSWSDESIAIVSDAGAPTFLVTIQRAQPDGAHAAAALVRSGVDSFTDDDADAGPTLRNLRAARAAGLLDASDVERAVLRLLELRLRTGEFDGEDDPYRATPGTAIDAPASRALAREAAARSVVVLRNDAGILPLAAPASIALVGPLADTVLTDWYAGTPPYVSTPAAAVAERWPDAAVSVASGADTVTLRAASTGRYITSDASGLVSATAETAGADARFDATDWGDGILTLRAHASGALLTGGAWPMRADAPRVGGWVVQESFERVAHADGTFSFLHRGSGRWVRVSREGGLVVADAVRASDAERFEVGVVVDGRAAVGAAAAAAEVVVVAVGNDPHLAGRETEDRPHLLLPDSAQKIWRSARAVNPRAVLAIISSYPYVLGEAAEADTVVWSSHGGQELGHGLVDILAGDREPTGRLAQSWPVDAAQAGDLFDYDTLRQRATYRHQGAPYAFALGHGLTYAAVAYDRIEIDEPDAAAPAPTRRHPALTPASDEHLVSARVRVRNTGSRAADELVQVYARAPQSAPLPAPRRLLVAYARVRLAPGEEREVDVVFALERLAVWDPAARVPGVPEGDLPLSTPGALRVQPGDYLIAAGRSADDLPLSATLSVR